MRFDLFCAGKLIGQFYDSNGDPTLDYHSVEEMVKRAEKANESKEADRLKFPPCNMEWSAETGSRVWCSRKRYISCFVSLMVSQKKSRIFLEKLNLVSSALLRY